MKSIRTLFILAVMLLCAGLPFAMDIPTYLKMKNGDIEKIEEIEKFALERGDLIEGSVEYVLGCCAEEYTTNFGIRTSDQSDTLYYVIWLNNDNFILYSTSSTTEYKQLDKITDETYAYLESYATYEESGDYEDIASPVSTLSIQGTVSKIPSNIEGYFREWYEEAVGSEEGSFDECCEPVMITHANFSTLGTSFIIGLVLAGCGLLSLILGIILAIRNQAKQKNMGYY